MLIVGGPVTSWMMWRALDALNCFEHDFLFFSDFSHLFVFYKFCTQGRRTSFSAAPPTTILSTRFATGRRLSKPLELDFWTSKLHFCSMIKTTNLAVSQDHPTKSLKIVPILFLLLIQRLGFTDCIPNVCILPAGSTDWILLAGSHRLCTTDWVPVRANYLPSRRKWK